MSDSDDEEMNRGPEKVHKRCKSEDDEQEQRGSPSKKVGLVFVFVRRLIYVVLGHRMGIKFTFIFALFFLDQKALS